MAVNKKYYHELLNELNQKEVQLIAVSKTRPADNILELYHEGQRDFGENYVNELVLKQAGLPNDIRWHFIGHLQRNKVKQIVGLTALIHSVDSLKLLEEINGEANSKNLVQDILLQVHIAEEETKSGMNAVELDRITDRILSGALTSVRVCGLMGMATFTSDENKVRMEFTMLSELFIRLKIRLGDTVQTLSMGMSADYKTAVACGSTMIRIGSALFGNRS